MIKPATFLLVLIGLALLGRLDKDGLLARGDLLAARVLGYEVHVEVRLRRSPDTACRPAGPPGGPPAVSSERPCK